MNQQRSMWYHFSIHHHFQWPSHDRNHLKLHRLKFYDQFMLGYFILNFWVEFLLIICWAIALQDGMDFCTWNTIWRRTVLSCHVIYNTINARSHKIWAMRPVFSLLFLFSWPKLESPMYYSIILAIIIQLKTSVSNANNNNNNNYSEDITCSFLASLTPSTLTVTLSPDLVAPVTFVFSLNFRPCLARDLWRLVEISMSMPTPPTLPKNSTQVTCAPSLSHTDPWLETKNICNINLRVETIG